MPAGWVRTAIVVAAALTAQPARADVIEIGDDGAASIRDSVAEVRWNAIEDVEAPAVPADAMTPIAPPPVPAAWSAALAKAAGDARLSPTLLAALVRQESGWRPGIVSRRGATGLTQLMPGTARALAVDPRDPAASLAGGARYLRAMLDRFDGDVERALAAYNAGPGRVARAGGLPAIAETRAYVGAILAGLSPAETERQRP